MVGALHFDFEEVLSFVRTRMPLSRVEGTAVPQPWLDYRQALRDITKQPDPMNIDWPTPPQD